MKPKDRKVSPVADWVKADVMGRIAAAGITFNTSRSSRGLGRRPNYTPEPDPLRAVEYTGNLAQDAATEINALEQEYRDRAKAEADRFKRATDSEFWFAGCFDSRKEKERSLQRAGLTDIGDKYLDGRQVADRLAIDLD